LADNDKIICGSDSGGRDHPEAPTQALRPVSHGHACALQEKRTPLSLKIFLFFYFL